MPRRSFLSRTGSIGPRRRQKLSMSFVVDGGCRGVLLPCLQDSEPILFGRSTHVTIFFVSNRHGLSLWLEYDTFHMYHSVIPYVCVDSSYRRLSMGLLLLCHEDRFFPVTGGMLLFRWRNPSLLSPLRPTSTIPPPSFSEFVFFPLPRAHESPEPGTYGTFLARNRALPRHLCCPRRTMSASHPGYRFRWASCPSLSTHHHYPPPSTGDAQTVHPSC